MKLTKAKADFIFLGILGIILSFTLYQSFAYRYVLSGYHFFAFAGWVAVMIWRIVKPPTGRYAVAWLITFGTFNLLNFFNERWTSFATYRGDKENYNTPGIDSRMFLILLIFYFVNRKNINKRVAQLFKGSDEERADKEQKMVAFYTDKFQALSQTEFDEVFQKIDAYPEEAQVALKRLHAGGSKIS